MIRRERSTIKDHGMLDMRLRYLFKFMFSERTRNYLEKRESPNEQSAPYDAAVIKGWNVVTGTVKSRG